MSGLKKIRIKRIYEAPSVDDGYRVFVDRLWPRGVKKEKASWDEWNKRIAPSTELRKWFGHKRGVFSAFADRYREELQGKKEEVERLRKVAGKNNVTLLYAAKDPEINHARVLRDFLTEAPEE